MKNPTDIKLGIKIAFFYEVYLLNMTVVRLDDIVNAFLMRFVLLWYMCEAESAIYMKHQNSRLHKIIY